MVFGTDHRHSEERSTGGSLASSAEGGGRLAENRQLGGWVDQHGRFSAPLTHPVAAGMFRCGCQYQLDEDSVMQRRLCAEHAEAPTLRAQRDEAVGMLREFVAAADRLTTIVAGTHDDFIVQLGAAYLGLDRQADQARALLAKYEEAHRG